MPDQQPRVEYMDLGTIVRAPRNPKSHDISALSASLDRFGFVAPLLVNERTGRLVAGGGRLDALQQRKASGGAPPARIRVEGDAWLVPVLRGVSFATDAEAEAYLVADNRLVELGGWDAAGLGALLSDLAAQDALPGTGYEQDDVDALLRDLGHSANGTEDPGVDLDRAGELQAKWRTEPGQLWTVGRHRVLCGDATQAADVARLMDGARGALLATDPPYNVGKDYGGGTTGDDKDVRAYEAFTRAWFGQWQGVTARQIVTPGCVNLASWLRWFDPYHVAPWTKTNAMTNGKVSRWWCWEPVLFFGEGWLRGRANDVFDHPVPPQRAEGMGSLSPYHPCPKPLQMWADLFDSYSAVGDVVADAFSGSGTALVAAEQSGRRCYGLEIEPRYVAVILERLQGLGLTPALA